MAQLLERPSEQEAEGTQKEGCRTATSSQGFLYSLEQLPVQAGTRFPMLLELVNRSISGPLDIRCDHSDLYYALNLGWIILPAREPQAVYDMNIVALRIGEHPRERQAATV